MISWITLLLILITTLAGLVGFLKEISSKYKKLFASLILLFAIMAGILNYYKEKDTSEKHALEFDTTLSKLNTTDKKISLAVDTLNFLLSKTNKVLDKNDTMLTKQDITYSTVDRIINPLFPLSLKIVTKISFFQKEIADLETYTYKLKEELENGRNSTNLNGLFDYSKKLIQLDLLKSQSVDNAELEIYLQKMHPENRLIRGLYTLKLKPSYQKDGIISENIEIPLTNENKSYTSLVINFEQKEYILEEEFTNLYSIGKSANSIAYGFNELSKSFLELTCNKNYPITNITLRASSDNSKSCYIVFDKKDRKIKLERVYKGVYDSSSTIDYPLRKERVLISNKRDTLYYLSHRILNSEIKKVIY